MIVLNWLEKLYFTYQYSLTFRILTDALSLLKALWVWVLAGVVVMAVLKTFVPREKIILFFRKRRQTSILGAALIGAGFVLFILWDLRSSVQFTPASHARSRTRSASTPTGLKTSA
jgi:uncharacterized membrane protein YraQ (UPF0718 family)